jgi:lysophospholipase L1-like esterase
MKKSKIALFTTFSVILFFLGLEITSHFALKKYFSQWDSIRLNINPILEYENNLTRIRRNPFNTPTLDFGASDVVFKNMKQTIKFPSKVSFDTGQESQIRSSLGDLIINKHGFRGPFFKKEKPKNIYRILTLGGSTTAGENSNELTWPRILERMLNNKLNNNVYFQVINGGVWANNSCHVKYLYEREIDQVKPNMVLLMTGWNDIDKLNHKNLSSEKDYCPKENILKKLNFYRLFSRLFFFTHKEKKQTGFSIFKHNLELYRNNLRKIIEDAKEKKILVGLVSLPSVMDRNTPTNKLKNHTQLKGLSKVEINYKRDAGKKINKSKKIVAKEYSNAFFVNSGISFSTSNKNLFFFDAIHPTGAGNRVLAYGVYKQINKKLNIHPHIAPPYNDKNIDGKQLEIEVIKSITASFKIEDLSYTGCVSFFKKCTFIKKPLQKLEYATSLVSFSLGSIIKFKKEIKNPYIKNTLETFLKKAINITPQYSIPYWVLAELYSINDQKDLEEKYKASAYKLNPLLKNISFQDLRNFYEARDKRNPLFLGLNDLIKILKKIPNYIALYQYSLELSSLNKNNISTKESISNHGRLIRSLYYTTPLLGNSIFQYAYSYFNSVGDLKTATFLKNSFHYVKPQYDN